MPDEPDYQIDDLDFYRLTGPVVGPAHTVHTMSRAGIPGHNIWLCGEHGVQQEIISVRDAVDLPAAREHLAECRALIAREPVDLRWAGEDMPFRVKVLEVEPIPDGLHVIVFARGGQEEEPEAMARLRWLVLPIPIEEEEEEDE